MEQRIDRRFEGIDRRLDALADKLDLKTDALDTKLARHFMWLAGMQITPMIAVVAALLAR